MWERTEPSFLNIVSQYVLSTFGNDETYICFPHLATTNKKNKITKKSKTTNIKQLENDNDFWTSLETLLYFVFLIYEQNLQCLF